MFFVYYFNFFLILKIFFEVEFWVSLSRQFSMCLIQGVFKNLGQTNVYCNTKIIFMWWIATSNIESTNIVN